MIALSIASISSFIVVLKLCRRTEFGLLFRSVAFVVFTATIQKFMSQASDLTQEHYELVCHQGIVLDAIRNKTAIHCTDFYLNYFQVKPTDVIMIMLTAVIALMAYKEFKLKKSQLRHERLAAIQEHQLQAFKNSLP